MKSVIAFIAICGLVLPAFVSGAILEKGEYTTEYSGTFYWECLDEIVYTEFSVPARYFVVETPSGNVSRIDKWLPNQLEGIIINLETGEIWDRTNFTANVVARETGGDGSMVEYACKGVIVNMETGERIVVTERYHVSSDANGEVHVEMLSLKCHPAGASPK